MSKKELLINGEIRDKEIRLIGDDGAQLGIVSSREGQRLANEKNLDLVKISPQANPPVCRIMNYGKFRFEQDKRAKEAKKNQKVVDIKEIRLSLKIDVHDFDTKVNQAIKFLGRGDRVKVAVRFRGREMAHTHLGTAVLTRFEAACSEVANIDKRPKLEGRSMIMFLSSKSEK